MLVSNGMTFSPSWKHYSIEMLLTSGLWITGAELLVTRPSDSYIGLLCVAVGAGILLRAIWNRSTTRYTIVDDRVECRQRQKVTTSTIDPFLIYRLRLRISPMERLLGVGTVAIYKSWGDKGSPEIVIYGVSSPEVFRDSLIDRSSSISRAAGTAFERAQRRVIEANKSRQHSCHHDGGYLLDSGYRYCYMCDAQLKACHHRWRTTHSYKEDFTEKCDICGMVSTNMGSPGLEYPDLARKCPSCRKQLRYEKSVDYQSLERSVCHVFHADTGTPICEFG